MPGRGRDVLVVTRAFCDSGAAGPPDILARKNVEMCTTYEADLSTGTTYFASIQSCFSAISQASSEIFVPTTKRIDRQFPADAGPQHRVVATLTDEAHRGHNHRETGKYWVRFKPAVNCTPTTPLLSDVGFEWSGKVASKQTSHFVDNSLLPSAVPFVDVDYRLQ
jgi:hypothetical protein